LKAGGVCFGAQKHRGPYCLVAGEVGKERLKARGRVVAARVPEIDIAGKRIHTRGGVVIGKVVVSALAPVAVLLAPVVLSVSAKAPVGRVLAASTIAFERSDPRGCIEAAA